MSFCRTIQGYLDDLLAKTDEEKENILHKAKKVKLKKEEKKLEAMQKIDSIDKQVKIKHDIKFLVSKQLIQVDEVLIRCYPILCFGLGWTDPFQPLAPTQQSLSFEVCSKYLPNESTR